MKSLKFYKTLSILLLVLNLGTISFFLFTKPPHPPKPGEHQISNEIGLDGAVKKKVDALEAKHHKEKRALMKRDFKLHQQLYKELSDTSAAEELITKINENREELETMTFKFFSEVAENCNKEQRQKLDEMINHSLRRITNHPPKKR